MKYTPWLQFNKYFGSYQEDSVPLTGYPIIVCRTEAHRWFKIPNTAIEIRLFVTSRKSEWVYGFEFLRYESYIYSTDGKHSIYMLLGLSNWLSKNKYSHPKRNYIGIEYR